MSLRDRIPVEPLSDERMTNIERRVVVAATDAATVAARPAPPQRARWLVGVLAAAGVAIVGVASWRLGAASAPAVVAEAPLHVDTTRATTLDIGDARITSEPATRFAITRPAGGVLLDMARGKVELEVGKRGDRPPLVVRAGDTDVVVVGTRFSVDYGDGTGEVQVVVTEGVVKVSRRTQPEARVAAGQAWTTARGTIAIADLPPTRVAAAGDAAHVAIARDALSGTSGGPATATDGAAASGTPAPSGAPTGSADAATSATGPDIAMPVDRVAKHGAEASGKKRTVVYDEDIRASLLKAPIQPALDVGLADPRQAITEHYRMVRENALRGDDASRAWYSIAVLQKLGLKDNAAALKTLDQYMERFAHKNRSEHADALWLRVRILCERTFDDACRRAARIYAAEAPSTYKSGIAERIVASPP